MYVCTYASMHPCVCMCVPTDRRKTSGSAGYRVQGVQGTGYKGYRVQGIGGTGYKACDGPTEDIGIGCDEPILLLTTDY